MKDEEWDKMEQVLPERLKEMIETAEMSEITYKQKETWEYYVYFRLNHKKYSIVVWQDAEGLFRPWNVYHESNKRCPFCDTKDKKGTCWTLKKQVSPLFRRVVESPSVRLEWLYIPHDTKGLEED